MRRWVWRVLLTVAVLAALTVGASAADSGIVVQSRIKYDLSTGTVLGGENNRITEAKIKDAVRGVKITAIADGAFSGYEGLGTLTIPSSIKTIGANAFRNCEKLSTVVIPENVEKIEEGAFYGCKGLKTLTFRDKVVLDSKGMPVVQQVTEIGPSAFAWCENLQDLTLSGSISVIGDHAFSKCDKMLTKVIIPAGVTKIGELAFGQCSKLSVVSIPATVGTFDAEIFGGNTNLKVVHYGGKVDDILPGLPPELKGGTGEEGKYVHSTTSLLPNAKAPSCTNEGSVEESVTCPQKCTGLNSDRKLPRLEHDYDWSKSADTAAPPPCQDQTWTYTGTCSKCGNIKTETETIKASADHQERETTEDEQNNETFIKEKVDATCGADGYKIVVTKVCTVCGNELETKSVTLSATGNHPSDKEVKTRKTLSEATCGKDGEEEVTVTCGVCGDELRVVKKKIPATGNHEWDEPKFVVTVEPTCLDKGKQVKKQLCKVCGEENPDYNKGQPAEEEEIDALGHDLEKETSTITTEPTCTEKGKKTVHARKCLRDGCTYVEPEQTGVDVDPLGHEWEETGEEIVKKATCKEEGLKKINKKVCTRCKTEEVGSTEILPKTAHNWGNPQPTTTDKDGNSVEDIPPKCGDPGVAHVIVSCQNKFEDGTVCDAKEYQTIEIPATGQHDWGEWTTKEPTATQPGEKKRTCKTCNKEDKIVLPATGDSKPDDPDKPSEPEKPKDYQVTIVQGAGGTASANRTTAKKGDKVTVTVSPSSGYVVDMVRVITADGKVPALTDLGGGKYRFTMPEANVEIRATFERKNSGPSWIAAPEDGSNGDPRRTKDVMPTQNPTLDSPKTDASQQLFKDVPLSHWAAGEINWANQMGYMNGSGGGFNPDGAITHQQMWMVLARLTGSNPAGMEDARRWAVQGGFADGSSPTGAVKRHQLVTALYRCARLSGSANQNTTSLAGYTDSRSVPAVARDAFSWALANGILSGGANKTLNPNGTLTRAQFAVILYRYSQRI